jgi:hypothetical protein
MNADPRLVNIRAIEQPLQVQLLAMAFVVFCLGAVLGGWHWGLAAASGVGSAMLYYRLLAEQVGRQFVRGHMPNPLLMIGFLAGRQIICLAAPAVCFFTLGTAWLACLVMLVVARHWILVVAWGGQTPALAAS